MNNNTLIYDDEFNIIIDIILKHVAASTVQLRHFEFINAPDVRVRTRGQNDRYIIVISQKTARGLKFVGYVDPIL